MQITQPAAPGRRSPMGLLCALLLAGWSASHCLAIGSDSCSGSETDCALTPLLTTYLALEAASFRPPACGTFGPAMYIERSDGLVNTLPFVGPISLTGGLIYDAGFINRPLHLIGCVPRFVSASISVNAGPPVVVTEAYTYNDLGLATRRLLTTNTGTFQVFSAYALNDYPARIQGDCQAGVSDVSSSQLNYDIFSRSISFLQSRPFNCDAGAPNARSISNSTAYTDGSRSPTILNTTVVESSATATITSTVNATASYMRDSAGRLARRDQTENFSVVVSNPPSSTSGSRTFAFTYAYDSAGRITQFNGNRGANTNALINYTYDSAGRVLTMNSTGLQAGQAANSNDSFTYDASGNLTSHVSNFTIGPNNTIINFTFTN